MSNLIVNSTNDSLHTINPLLAKNSQANTNNNQRAEPTAVKPTVNTAVKTTVNKDSSAKVTLTASQTPNLGLYNNQGLVPVQSVNKPVEGNGNFIATGGPVQVDILSSDSGYDNKIYWSTDNFKTKHYIGIDNQTGSQVIGNFTAGTQIKFGIDNGVGGFFTTGTAADNSDKFQHAKSLTTSSGTQISFEDLQGGGDRDYNDVIINVKNLSSKTTPSEDSKNNHSGLGDGTNPGQGSGKTNSPNVGTNNPNNAASSAVINGSTLKTQATQSNKAVPVATVKPTPSAQDITAPQTVNNSVKQLQDSINKQTTASKQTTESKIPAPAKPAVTIPAKETSTIKTANNTSSAKANEVKDAKNEIKANSAPTNNQSKVNTATKNTSTNHSGLADGTNPGQGAVNTKSANQGVNNPNNKATTTEAKLLNTFLGK